MKEIELQKEHAWLQQLLGEWTYEGEAMMGPDKPAERFAGTERVRSVGNVWFIAESEGGVVEGPAANTMATFGYDVQKQRFVGSFIGSMMTNLWIYDGALDAAGKVLTLDTEGPGMSEDGKLARYRDVLEVVSADHRTMSSEIQGDDGTWTRFMSMTYRRTNA